MNSVNNSFKNSNSTPFKGLLSLIFVLMLMSSPFKGWSQGGIYPVQVNTVIQPPFTLNYNDYTLPGKFFSQIFLADRNREKLEVYLKLTIKGPNNINIFTTNPQAHPPVSLSGGSITTVTSDEYGYLFSTNNLTFSGIAPQAPLPEGFYIFNIEVIEKKTGITVSNSFVGGFSTMIVRSDPPFLNTPVNQKNIEMTVPQPTIPFQWTPRQVSLNTVNNIKYNLRVVRISTPGTPPNQAMNSGAPKVLDIVTTGTSFAWDMNNPQIITDPLANSTAGALIDNNSIAEGVFAWQVQAIDPNNSDVFKNQGYSEVYSFTYSKPCDLPVLQSLELQPDNSIKVNLIANESHQLYEVFVKELGSKSFAQKVSSETQPILISNLDPSMTYEVQTRAQCGVAWTNKAYMGTVTTTGSTGTGCLAPTTILSEVKEDTLVTFKWDNSNLSGEYRLFLQLEGKELEELIVTDTVYTTTVLTANYPLELSVDAVCGDKFGLGTAIKLTQATNGYVGECTLPERNGFVPELQGVGAYATWSKLPEHQSFDLRYRKQGDANWIPEQTLAALPRPQAQLDSIKTGVQYEYQLKYTCASEATAWSDTRTFLLDQSSSTNTNNVTSTGSCMPPRAVLDELTGETSIEIKWDKVSGVREYELLYRPLSVPTWTTVKVSGRKYELENLLPTTPYIYQIRCVCQDGASVSSDELRFRTGDSLSFSKDCPKVELITAIGISETQLTTAWQKDDAHDSFVLFYKEDKQSIGDWYQHLTPDPTYLLDHLKPNTLYNFKVQATCGTDKAKESEPFDFKTLPSEDPREDFECGAESPDACDRTGPALTGALQVDDIITAHDFKIKVLEGSGNPFNGKGQVVVPYMNNAQVLVDLKSVEVNEDLCMTGGRMITTGMHLQLFPDEFIARVNGVLTAVDNTFSKVETSLDQASGYLDQIDDIINTITEPIDLSAYDDMSPEEMFEEGKRLYNENKDKFDKYTSGKLDNIDVAQVLTDIKTGAALIKKAIEMGAGIIHQIDEYDNLDSKNGYTVTFTPSAGNETSFDAYDGNEFAKFYQQMGTAEEGVKYFVPYIGIDGGQTKKVIATVAIADLDKTKLTFITNSIVGQDLQVIQPNKLTFIELSENKFEVTVPADAKRVYAMYKTTDGLNHRMAKLHVVETPALTQKVVIIPNSASHRINAQTIQTTLNQIYDIPNVTFSVEVRAPYTAKDWDAGNDGMQVDDHKFMSRYSNEMKDLKNAYFSQNTSQDTANAVYLFVVHKMVNTEGGNILGYMPRNKSVGFLAPNPSNRTIAHELGHGLFRLAHTWQLDNTQPEGSTQNLMDYDNGTTLLGAQWEQIHNPSFDIYGLDNTEDGQQGGNAWKISAIIDAMATNSMSTDFTFINTSDKYKATGSHPNIPMTFKLGTVNYSISDVSLNFGEEIDLTQAYIQVTDEYSKIKISFKNAEGIEKLWLKFNSISSVWAFSQRMGRNGISRTASTQVQNALNQISKNSDLSENDLSLQTSSCVLLCRNEELQNIPIQVRIDCFDNIVAEDANWKRNDRNLLVELTSSINSTADQIKFIQDGFAANNYNWINLMTTQLAEYSDFSDGDDLVAFYELSEVLNPLIKNNYSSLNITPVKYQYPSLDIVDMTFYEFYPGQDNFYIGAEEGDTYSIFDNYSVVFANSSNPFKIQFEAGTGKVHMSQSYVYRDNQTYIYATGSSPPDRDIPTTYSADFNPFEPVTITFAQNYPVLGYNAGYTTIMPAYMALLLNQSIANNDFDENVRLVTNCVQVAAAVATIPFSGGSSIAVATVALTRIAGVVATVDIGIQKEKQSLSVSEYQSDIAFYDAWDTFKTAVDFAELGAGTAIGISKMPMAIRRLNQIRSWKRFNAVCRNNTRRLRANIKDGWQKIKSGYVFIGTSTEVFKSRLLSKISGNPELKLVFTDSELEVFINHAKGLGLEDEVIDALLIVHVRKHWVSLDELKKVTASISQKSQLNSIDFKDGWNFKRAFISGQERLAIGSYLSPSEYLTATYIQRHLLKFHGKSSYLITGDQFDAFVAGRNVIGRADGQFISTSQKVDEVLAKANGSVSKIETELGIPTGTWQNKGGIYRIDIHNPENLHLRIPKGSETGANEFWHPGGITSGGVIEAVVDEIPKNMFTATQIIK